jgi:Domain of unknown function (DUF5710)
MDRTYLFVPPEEKDEVLLRGAHWDATSKCWYIGPDETPARFSKWLPSAADEEEFNIVSSQAYVAAATIPCEQCRASIEVICIHCGSGTASGEPLTEFTVSHVWAMDKDLTRQLLPWPAFRRVSGPDGESGGFANHCSHCGTPQEDMFLHDEPDTPFFDIPRAPPGAIKLAPLVGTIQLSGDEHFTVE